MGWEIIHSRLARDQPMTLEEIGRRWGVSRERVRQIEMRTKLLLSRHLARVEAEEEAEASMARAS
jgi:RNA polymerase primary sigma factor